MKTRIAFVSNSSSCSYLIKINRAPACCEACGRSDPDLVDIFLQLEDSDYESGIKTDPDELKSRLTEMLEWVDDQELIQDTIKKVVLGAGRYALLNVSYHNHLAQSMFEEAKRTGQITVLWGDH